MPAFLTGGGIFLSLIGPGYCATTLRGTPGVVRPHYVGLPLLGDLPEELLSPREALNPSFTPNFFAFQIKHRNTYFKFTIFLSVFIQIFFQLSKKRSNFICGKEVSPSSGKAT